MAWLMAAVGVIMVPHRFMTWTAFQRIGLLLAVTAYALVYPLQKLGPIPYFIVVAFDISVLIAIGHLLHARIGLAFLLIFFRVLYWPSPNDPNLHDLADFFFATSREFPLIAISLPIWASRHLPSVLETATWLDSADEPAVSGSEDR